MKKLLSIFSIASITTILFTSPLWAKPINYRGEKGTYTIDSQAGTYRGCLESSGCIFLGRKYFVPCKGIECETRAWKKGEYVYAIGGENELSVSKNGQIIFSDYLSIIKPLSKSRKSVVTKSSAIAKPTRHNGSQLPKVGILINQVNAPGCYYSALRTHNQSKSVFRNNSNNVYMNLNGRDVKLQIIEDRLDVFRTGDTQIRLMVTNIPWKNSDGESSNGTIQITRNGKSKVIKVVGDCGH